MRTLKLKDNNYWDTSSIMHNKTILKELLNSIFPIGKVEIFYDALDHSNYFGFTWERCSLERSPIGYNPNSSDTNYKTIGKQFGEKTHTLTVAEMPSHTHLYNDYYNCAYTTSSPRVVVAYSSSSTTVGGQGTANAGGNQAHNTVHPVEVMAFWKRVS